MNANSRFRRREALKNFRTLGQAETTFQVPRMTAGATLSFVPYTIKIGYVKPVLTKAQERAEAQAREMVRLAIAEEAATDEEETFPPSFDKIRREMRGVP